eukprot:274797-Hanusia_phi.AAC.2
MLLSLQQGVGRRGRKGFWGEGKGRDQELDDKEEGDHGERVTFFCEEVTSGRMNMNGFTRLRKRTARETSLQKQQPAMHDERNVILAVRKDQHLHSLSESLHKYCCDSCCVRFKPSPKISQNTPTVLTLV